MDNEAKKEYQLFNLLPETDFIFKGRKYTVKGTCKDGTMKCSGGKIITYWDRHTIVTLLEHNSEAQKHTTAKLHCSICGNTLDENYPGGIVVGRNQGSQVLVCGPCDYKQRLEQPISSGEIQDPDDYKFNWWPDAEAQKHDTAKPRYDLLPPEALDEVVKVLTFGARKYGDRNWEKGLTYSRCFAAAMRHLWAWWRGEDLDPESGLSHLAHAGCCVLFLLSYTKWGHQTTDDRLKRR